MSVQPRTPYGHELEPDLAGRLRGRVPVESLAWVEHTIASRVRDQQALDGGLSSAVHLLITEAAPPLDRLVLRRYVLDWVHEEPEIPGNEALALRLLENNRAGVPAPRMVAADPDGSQLGVPTTLMTALPGTLVWEPADRAAWLRCLAELAVRIHSLPVSSELSEWAPYAPDSRTPPVWSRHPEAWLLAYELWDGPTPASERVFLHRDFHPGNVLWTGESITGVVDWASACAGPPEEDIAQCRADLVVHHGQDWAEEFLAIWQDLAGKRDYSPYWDLTNVVSFDHTKIEPRIDDYVAAAAARL